MSVFHAPPAPPCFIVQSVKYINRNTSSKNQTREVAIMTCNKNYFGYLAVPTLMSPPLPKFDHHASTGTSLTRTWLERWQWSPKTRIIQWIVLSRASEVGSPTNHLGSRQRQDTGPEILLPKNFKKKNGPYTGPVLLRQGEPGTSQYHGSTS